MGMEQAAQGTGHVPELPDLREHWDTSPTIGFGFGFGWCCGVVGWTWWSLWVPSIAP